MTEIALNNFLSLLLYLCFGLHFCLLWRHFFNWQSRCQKKKKNIVSWERIYNSPITLFLWVYIFLFQLSDGQYFSNSWYVVMKSIGCKSIYQNLVKFKCNFFYQTIYLRFYLRFFVQRIDFHFRLNSILISNINYISLSIGQFVD